MREAKALRDRVQLTALLAGEAESWKREDRRVRVLLELAQAVERSAELFILQLALWIRTSDFVLFKKKKSLPIRN